MNSTRKIVCIGEAIVDFVSTQPGTSIGASPGFVKCAGGAAANVSAGLAKLGSKAAFVGAVGDDAFGRFAAGELRALGVDVSGIRFDPGHGTRLAFVSLSRSGERTFEFWERNPADRHLRRSDIRMQQLTRAAIVHISSFVLISDASRRTAMGLARELRRSGCEVSFDPNLRLSLWDSPLAARRVLNGIIRHCTILRLNEEEATFLTGHRDPAEAAKSLLEAGPSLVVVTRGRQGCVALTRHAEVRAPGHRVRVSDTTGCGDAFMAALLDGIARLGTSDPEPAALRKLCIRANAAAALTATKTGVIGALPSSNEVNRFLKTKIDP